MLMFGNYFKDRHRIDKEIFYYNTFFAEVFIVIALFYRFFIPENVYHDLSSQNN